MDIECKLPEPLELFGQPVTFVAGQGEAVGRRVAICNVPKFEAALCGFGVDDIAAFIDLLRHLANAFEFSFEGREEWWQDMFVAGHRAAKDAT